MTLKGFAWFDKFNETFTRKAEDALKAQLGGNEMVPLIHAEGLVVTEPCQEASILSRETFIPCGAPAEYLVWHDREQKAYRMCLGCANHNVRNRGAKLLVAVGKESLPWR